MIRWIGWISALLLSLTVWALLIALAYCLNGRPY